ncbi:restriction endonuclease subunit S [Aphanizomenon flos-aquae NRERC-008]|uniref:Restriction endonuclease subunit S n=1 Tax=Aphanizomenon flos-aquae FACHB-1249 TaxID=2692889 RepID=A0ABR8IT89_APHFL|nr:MULTISPECIES: restriction endonuclease subunit S [Aphanizomenon]MBD2390374.1 restriction endonuclease subunit S [Aphanizomenon flos-aquae FACHB-1171]MBD2557775.1 restriction endonuclease subunit S [Aphanizomenon flos-aquae FACHB-1290]MBD2632655.1 restriction endonuclease subunit S [Aphanizomenon sp. FACHB-1399]MBD2643588.1 restriction endonuclease subunit S [Aphanizomenon sp. FACHB-1401]MBD2657243.1 restriction endonuclease subunit S [Aphanizomenon flos-aquae FACHB-1265]
MGNYQGYQKYKDSGVVWLGDIPEHWEVKRLKQITKLIDGDRGKNYPNENDLEDDGIPFLSTDNIKSNAFNFSSKTKFITLEKFESLSRGKLIKNDLVVTMRGTIGQTALFSNVPYQTAFINAQMIIVRPINIFAEFLKYISMSLLWSKQLDFYSYGTAQQQLSGAFLGVLYLGFPPLDEQEKIAQFLDYKTKQIDELIKKKETLIEKLDEKRTAIISHAVTKGLDSSVPIKDSGIEWLGDIPKHWKSIRIKFIGDIKYGLGEPPEQLDDGLPIIRATDIYRGIIDGSKVQRVNPDKVPWSRNPELKVGDILVVRSGAYTGDSAIVPDEWAGAIAGYDMVLTPTKAYSKYIALNLLSKHILEGQIYLAKSRAAQPHLNAEELGNTIICLPPIKEQKLISQYLDQKTTQIDQQKAKIKQAIELLKEYRTSLITNAVTGKIDVSQIAIPSPQKPQPQKG